MADVNSHVAANIAGLQNPIDFTTPATDALKVQALIDVVSWEATSSSEHRLFLDEMSAAARDSLIAILTALKAAVT